HAANHARTVASSITAIVKIRRDTHNQIARASTVPKNTPGRSGTSQTATRGVHRIPSCPAKLLRIAETTASAARIIARLSANALHKPRNKAPTNEIEMTGLLGPAGQNNGAVYLSRT